MPQAVDAARGCAQNDCTVVSDPGYRTGACKAWQTLLSEGPAAHQQPAGSGSRGRGTGRCDWPQLVAVTVCTLLLATSPRHRDVNGQHLEGKAQQAPHLAKHPSAGAGQQQQDTLMMLTRVESRWCAQPSLAVYRQHRCFASGHPGWSAHLSYFVRTRFRIGHGVAFVMLPGDDVVWLRDTHLQISNFFMSGF